VDLLQKLVREEVLKREVVEGDKANAAVKLMRRANRPLRKSRTTNDPVPTEET
jgi:hypothetical protein